MSKSNEGSKKITRSARLRWVKLGTLRVLGIAQRDLRPARVEHLLSRFDLDLLGNPVVSEREDVFHVIDGQHRIETLKQWLGEGWESQEIQCWVYSGLSDAEEADLFDYYNDVLSVAAIDKFRARVTAGRSVESDIDRQVRHEGLVVTRDKVPGAIGAVGTLVRIYNRADAATLGRALRIIRDSYGDVGLKGEVIDGIAHLCQRYNGQVSDDAVVARLSRANGGLGGLLNQAEVLRRQTGNAKAICVAAAAVEILNRGKGGPKLPTWWKSGS